MDDVAFWRRRLLAYTAVRAVGAAIFLFGVAIIYTNVLRRGGWPQVGALVAIVGVIDALIAPRILRKRWERQDRERR
jgi:hypothetical protein